MQTDIEQAMAEAVIEGLDEQWPVNYPIGCIMPAADIKSTALTNWWMYCNGQPLSKAEYPELFDVLSYSFGGSGPLFNVPSAPDFMIRVL